MSGTGSTIPVFEARTEEGGCAPCVRASFSSAGASFTAVHSSAKFGWTEATNPVLLPGVAPPRSFFFRVKLRNRILSLLAVAGDTADGSPSASASKSLVGYGMFDSFGSIAFYAGGLGSSSSNVTLLGNSVSVSETLLSHSIAGFDFAWTDPLGNEISWAPAESTALVQASEVVPSHFSSTAVLQNDKACFDGSSALVHDPHAEQFEFGNSSSSSLRGWSVCALLERSGPFDTIFSTPVSTSVFEIAFHSFRSDIALLTHEGLEVRASPASVAKVSENGKNTSALHNPGESTNFFQWTLVAESSYSSTSVPQRPTYIGATGIDSVLDSGADRGFVGCVDSFYLWGREITAEEVSRVASRAFDGTPL